jgi:hypothetical protein
VTVALLRMCPFAGPAIAEGPLATRQVYASSSALKIKIFSTFVSRQGGATRDC